MKPPPFQYHDPKTLAEAVGLLGRLDNAKLLAGGQSLMPMLNMRFVQPDHVIDLNLVEGMSGIRESGGTLEIGAMTRQRDLEFSDLIEAKCPLLHEAITHIGHRQTRNRGTIGGSLCHLDPAAELVSVCAAHDATVTVAGPNGTRAPRPPLESAAGSNVPSFPIAVSALPKTTRTVRSLIFATRSSRLLLPAGWPAAAPPSRPRSSRRRSIDQNSSRIFA